MINRIGRLHQEKMRSYHFLVPVYLHKTSLVYHYRLFLLHLHVFTKEIVYYLNFFYLGKSKLCLFFLLPSTEKKSLRHIRLMAVICGHLPGSMPIFLNILVYGAHNMPDGEYGAYETFSLQPLPFQSSYTHNWQHT